jgi:hypothetical protein
MQPQDIGKVIRSLRSAGLEAGRTDDGRSVWARITRVNVETREPFHDTILIRDVSDLRALYAAGTLQ